jgi:hypothetical protein
MESQIARGNPEVEKKNRKKEYGDAEGNQITVQQPKPEIVFIVQGAEPPEVEQ